MSPTHRLVPREVRNYRTIFGVFLALLIGPITGCGVSQNGVVQVSTNAFDFGQVAVSTKARRIVVTVTNPGNAAVALASNVSGNTDFILNPSVSCPSSVAAGGSCSIVFTYLPSATGTATATLALTYSSAQKTATENVSITGTGVTLDAGDSLVTATNNPLVASYIYHPTSAGTVAVEFGLDTSYGRKTWAVPTPANGSALSIYVAGMQPNSTYHMRALFTAADGSVMPDTDHTFTTGTFNSEVLPKISVTTGTGTPQPGIELLDSTAGTDPNYLEAYATDLKGNLIWAYNIPDRQASTIIQPIKLLPNGHFLMILSYNSQSVATDGAPVPGTLDVLREIDLAGNPVREISADTLNTKLAAGKDGPLNCYVKDLDGNGSVEQLVTCFIHGQEYPFLGKDQLELALPGLKRSHLRYDEVAGKDIRYLFGNQLDDARVLHVDTLASLCLFNTGHGNFTPKALPPELQLSPVFSFTSLDTLATPHALLPKPVLHRWLAAGNFYGVQPYEGRYDAANPTIFTYDRDFHCIGAITQQPGEWRDAKRLQCRGRNLILLAQNNGELQFVVNGH